MEIRDISLLDQIKVEVKKEPMDTYSPIELAPFEEQYSQFTFKAEVDEPAQSVPSTSTIETDTTIQEPKGFNCNSCKKNFKTKELLRVHFQTEYPDQECQLVCRYCKKIFRFVSLLNQHIVWHTGERPYKCDICERQFGMSNDLRRHMLKHVEDEFKCPVCDLRLAGNRSLLQHVRTHEMVRPWKCDVVFCQKLFKEKKDLTSHQKAHRNPCSRLVRPEPRSLLPDTDRDVLKPSTVICESNLKSAILNPVKCEATKSVPNLSQNVLETNTFNLKPNCEGTVKCEPNETVSKPCTLTFQYVRNGKLVKKKTISIPRPVHRPIFTNVKTRKKSISILPSSSVS